MKRFMYFIAATLAALASVVIAGLAWLVVVYPTRPPAPGQARTVALQLVPGTDLGGVARQLAEAKLIDHAAIFALYARVLGAEQRLKQGKILVTSQMNVRQLLQRTAYGFGATPVLVTIPEGYNSFDIAQRLAEWGFGDPQAFLQSTAHDSKAAGGTASETVIEGYLFPDTYWLRDDLRPEQVIARLTDNAERRMNKLLAGEAPAREQLAREFGFGLREIVILASIVEKEAHVREEQPMIAGVFLNRLRNPRFRPKRLQADPTVAYGCLLHKDLPSCAGFDGKHVTRTMTADPLNPYNTYRIEGLPPTPIANPGLSALHAVLHPSEHGYLYFVARGDGRHTFSVDLDAHNQATATHRETSGDSP